MCCGCSLHNPLFSHDDATQSSFLYGIHQPRCYRYTVENIVLDRFGDIHFTSAQGKKKQPFEMKPIWSETRNRTSDRFTNLILTGGLTGATCYSSLSLLADQYQESGHYDPLKALREQSICYYFSSAGCI